MKKMTTFMALAVLGTALASTSFAQRPQRPQRPADSYGKPGQRPPNAPQRPPGTYGNPGGRPKG